MGTWRSAEDREHVRSRGSTVLVAVAACSLVLLSGCAANFDSQTNTAYQPAQGVSDRTGDVYAINTLAVADDAGNGTVVASLINQTSEADKLVSLMAEDSEGGGLEVAPLPDDGIPLAPQTAVDTAYDGVLRITGAAVVPGLLVRLTFGFENAAPLQVEVPVVTSDDTMYADVPVGAAPEASS